MLGPNHRLHRWNCWRPTQPTRGAPRRVSGSLRSWRVPHGSAPLCLVDPSCRGSATLGGDGADGPTRRRRGADRARCPRPRIPKRAAPGGSSQTLGGDRIPTALGGGCPWAVSRRTAVPRGGPSGAGPNRRALRDARQDRRLAGGAEAARTRARGAVTATVDPAGKAPRRGRVPLIQVPPRFVGERGSDRARGRYRVRRPTVNDRGETRARPGAGERCRSTQGRQDAQRW